MQNKLNCVLLIDDDEATNFIHQMVIEDSGRVESIVIRQSAFDALSFLKSSQNGKHPQPDIIFLDINMPAMDGWEFLEEYDQLTKDQKGKIMVVMLTTSVNPDDIEKAKNYNTIGSFIHKPLTLEQFLALLDKDLQVGPVNK